MRVSILSSRDSDPNVNFTLSFNVTFGPPSRIFCNYNNKETILHNVRSDDHPNLSREVIRSQYVSISQPDMTRVIVKVNQPIREERIYKCAVVVEGRVNIVSGYYGHYIRNPWPFGITTANVTCE